MNGVGKVGHKGVFAAVNNVFCAHLTKQGLLLVFTHNVDEIDAAVETNAVKHLAEIRRRCRVHKRSMTLEVHRLDHA